MILSVSFAPPLLWKAVYLRAEWHAEIAIFETVATEMWVAPAIYNSCPKLPTNGGAEVPSQENRTTYPEF